jgi:hypothetical protein
LPDGAAPTVSREISRHGGRPAYRAHDADDHAWDWTLRPRRCLLALQRKLRNIVASKLILDWSPEQISGWLKTHYPDEESLRVSHETIYRSLFIQAGGVLKKELLDHLRSKRRMLIRRVQVTATNSWGPTPTESGKRGRLSGSSTYGNENTPLAPSESRSQKSADGRMATGAGLAKWEQTHGKKKAKFVLTSTGLLMEGLR